VAIPTRRFFDTVTIIADLEAERDRLDRAIAAVQFMRTVKQIPVTELAKSYLCFREENYLASDSTHR